jgi:outer membrane lipoprotein-sorting protein
MLFVMKQLRSVFIILMFGFSQSFAQDAATLLLEMDKIMFSPKDKQGKITITLSNKDGKEKAREAIMLQKGTDKKLYRYTKPESQEGIATLALPDDIMWMYMPAFGKPKKVSRLATSQSFTGTDFSYEDMATSPYAERYDPVLVEKNDKEYVLDLTPKLDNKSKYDKIRVHLHKTNYYPLLMEFFDKGGNKFKEATYTYEKIGPYWNAAEVVMTDLKKDHSTTIQLTDVKFDQGLSDDEFTVDKLGPQDEK